MNNCIPLQRDWVDILAALLTPTIAILGSYIALRQWLTNKNKLKLDLFDKRYAVFEAVKKFIATILAEGKVDQDKSIEFLRHTKSAAFLFDDKIVKLTEELHNKAIKLNTLKKTQDNMSDEQLKHNLDKQDELFQWFEEQMKSIDDRFKKYLKLRH